MKSILFLTLFWGCMCMAHVANGYGRYIPLYNSPAQPVGFDTVSISPFNPGGSIAPIVVLPAPGAKLNYTQIMFEHPQLTGAGYYLIQVALNVGNTPFQDALVTKTDSSTATIIGNLQFGKKYIWRYTGIQNGKRTGWQGPYYFETLSSPLVDKNQIRVRVLQNDTQQNGGGLIALDLCGTIIDRTGNPVWFYPMPFDVNGNTTIQGFVNVHNNDMQLTPVGTITSIMNHKAQERDLNGQIIWQAPAGVGYANNSVKYNVPFVFHHGFKKLANGNYMVIDQDNMAVPDSVFNRRNSNQPYNVVAKSAKGNTLVADDIIKEFDRTGKLVWSWSAENYFNSAELITMLQTIPDKELLHPEPGGHMNAFDVDQQNGFVYAGFRNVSRVIKIEKKTGKVVCAWGDNIMYNQKPNGNNFFFKQHGTTLLHNGNLAVFNNNPQPVLAPGESAKSEVVIFSQPTNKSNSKIIWQYHCSFDSTGNMASVSGNVSELKNNNLLVCMGAVNRIFEITLSKKIVWNALVERYNTPDSTWYKFPLYRAHYTSSLYPCYFTVQTGNGQIKIFNDGTEDDSYQVDVISAMGIKQIAAAFLQSNKSLTINLTAGTLPCTVTVTSKTNPALNRVVQIQ